VPRRRHSRFLIVGFDGLRPDLISAEVTPNICRVQAAGITLARHKTVYPSETRVAFTSLVTGASPATHGLVGNRYVERAGAVARYVDTADAARLEALDAESGGRLLGAATLGEILAAGGRSMAVLATNSRGATRLLNHKARSLEHICLSGHFADVSTPADYVRPIMERFGPPIPDSKSEPNLDAQAYITTAFLDHVRPELAPDVTILFYGEPDVSSHFKGILSSKTREAIGFADRQLGRIVDWWEAEGRAAGTQLVVISDHGHVTQHSRVSVADALRSAGFRPGANIDAQTNILVVPGHVGALYLSEPDENGLERAVAAVTEQPWCGAAFTAGRNEIEGRVRGTLAKELVLVEHVRAPDVLFSFRTDDRLDPYGLVGGSYFDNDRAPGTGVHGGLHPKELAAMAILAGSEFRGRGVTSITPSSICDLTPTILYLLGIPCPASVTGRVLTEAITAGEIEQHPASPPEVIETGRDRYIQALRRVRVGRSVYLEGAWAGGDASAEARRDLAG
jgi:arylsulfatase A-like enzyme